MTDEQFQKILERLARLEKIVLPNNMEKPFSVYTKKSQTLPELIRGRKFSNASEKIAIVVGYKEKIVLAGHSSKKDIREGWIEGKFDGLFRTNLIERSVKDGLVRKINSDAFDLSQTGELFFNTLINSDAGNN